MIQQIYQVRITLNGSNPKIWRKLLVPSDTKLSDFHEIIQTAMGWENCHLHQFIKDKNFYTVRRKDDDFWEEMNNIDYKNMKISDLLMKEKDSMIYEYDFGDGWVHKIILEKILQPEENSKYPICIDGKRNCPPEDCGGIWGYSDLLEALKYPESEEYEDALEWLGEDFDPAYFDKERVNALLHGRNFGIRKR